ncbi:mechanosensitive ion channel family protein, partial [bacterium]|nr:mechanosensitive ion channel family protein [bacterium]
MELLQNWLLGLGISESLAFYLARGTALVAVLLLSVITNVVAKRYILSALGFVIARSKTKWDDAILQRRVLSRLTHLAPALVIYVLTPVALSGMESTIATARSATQIYMILIVMLALDSFLNAVIDIYRTFDIAKEVPIKGFVQIVKLVLYFLSVIFIISIVLNKTPVFLLSGLGALTAVLMLIFKDAILGFVAGIQLTANKMVAHGDWIEM